MNKDKPRESRNPRRITNHAPESQVKSSSNKSRSIAKFVKTKDPPHKSRTKSTQPKSKRPVKPKKQPWESDSGEEEIHENPEFFRDLDEPEEEDEEADLSMTNRHEDEESEEDFPLVDLQSIRKINGKIDSASGSDTNSRDSRSPLPLTKMSEENKQATNFANACISSIGFEEEIDEDTYSDVPVDLQEEYRPPSLLAYEQSETRDSFEERCLWLEEPTISTLVLPSSSDDLPVDKPLVIRVAQIYEFCRRFGSVVRLWPFTVEDFCACLSSTCQSPLLDELHLSLMRLLFKDDEEKLVQFGAHDCKDSLNATFYFLDHLTYGEVLRRYLESDNRFSEEVLDSCSQDYPFVHIKKRIVVLEWLCHQAMTTKDFKDYMDNEGVIVNDDDCRDCGKAGDLLCCDSCSAVYHMNCLNPPLNEAPDDKWQCPVCSSCKVDGVIDCITESLSSSTFNCRSNYLGFDRHGRRYYFIARRIFVEDTTASDVWYFSTLLQLRQMVDVLDALDYEKYLCRKLLEQSDDIISEMIVTETLTAKKTPKNRESWIEADNRRRLEIFMPFNKLKKTTSDQNDEENSFESFIVKLNTLLMERLNSKSNEENESVPVFRLGMNEGFFDYTNQYSTNPLAKTPYMRADEHRVERNMTTRFCLEEEHAIKWINDGEVDERASFVDLIRFGIGNLLYNQLPRSLLHILWPEKVAAKFKDDLMKARRPEEFSGLLLTFEANMKPIIFTENWRNSLGHIKLYRQTLEDKEERKNKEKFLQVNKKHAWLSATERDMTSVTEEQDDENENGNSSIIWVKYALMGGPPKHEVWKLKDETFRINGVGSLGGWIWYRTSRRIRYQFAANNAFCGQVLCKSDNAHMIDDLFRDFVEDKLDFDETNQSQNVFNNQIDINQPAFASLPMDFNVETAEFEINKCQAITKLHLQQFKQSFNVSLALTQHSLYYKVARGSKFLDTLLLARMNQFEEDSQQCVRGRQSCYSASCRSNRHMGIYKCYSSNCRASSSTQSTKLPHKLIFDTKSKDLKSKLSMSKGNKDRHCIIPKIHSFKSTRLSKPNILVLQKHSARSLARNIYDLSRIEGYSLTARGSHFVWPYPCLRPLFNYCWRYQLVNAQSLHSIVLLFKILYSSIQWPLIKEVYSLDSRRTRHANGFTEIREIITHQLLPPFGLISKYFIRISRIPEESIVPTRRSKSNNHSSDEETMDPKSCNFKLRDRRKIKSLTKPSTSLKWMQEHELALWEVKNYWHNQITKARIEQLKHHDQHLSPNKISTTRPSNENLSPGPAGSQISGKYIPIAPKTTVQGRPLSLDQFRALSSANNQKSPLPIVQGQKFVIVTRDKDGKERVLHAMSAKSQMTKQVDVNAPNMLSSAQFPTANAVPEKADNTKTAFSFISRHSIGQPVRKPTAAPVPAAHVDNNETRFKLENDEISLMPVGNVDMLYDESDYNEEDENEEKNFPMPRISSTLPTNRTIKFSEDLEEEYSDDEYQEDVSDEERELNRYKFNEFNDDYRFTEFSTTKETKAPATKAKTTRRRRTKNDSSSEATTPVKTPRSSKEPTKRSRARKPSETPVSTPSQPRQLASKDPLLSLRKIYVEQDRKIRAVVANMVNEMVTKIHIQVREETKALKRLQNQEARKLQMQQSKKSQSRSTKEHKKWLAQMDQQVSDSVRKIRREIGKRRAIMQDLAMEEAKYELDNGEYDALMAYRGRKIGIVRERGRPRKYPLTAPTPAKIPKTPVKKASLITSKSLASSSGSEESGSEVDVPPEPQIKRPKIEDSPRFSPPRPDENRPDTSCVCRRPYDPTKFYVGCDLCSRFFHGKCVGVTPQISKRITSWYCPECQKERQNAKLELYCLCRTPYDESLFYISCDCCDLWFHGKCVGVEPADGDDIQEFVCPDCQRNRKGTIQPMLKPLNDKDFDLMLRALYAVELHRMSWPFRRKVDIVMHPSYSTIISDHIDLPLLRTKVEQKHYKMLNEFSNDVSLMFNNARKYFPPDAPEFQCATVLDRFFSDRLHELKQKMIND